MNNSPKSKINLPLLLMTFGLAATTACNNPKTGNAGNDMSDLIRLNQVGYYPDGEKIAVLSGESSNDIFTVRNYDNGKVVYKGQLSASRKSPFSDKTTRIADFSNLNEDGKFYIEIEGAGNSYPFEIRNKVLEETAKAALKGFYYQRMSMPLEEEYAGKWKRPAAHLDEEVLIHASAVSKGRAEGSVISSPKGWYDAGDYNKYIVNSGFTLGVLLSLMEDFPEYAKSMNTNIPESRNNVPDLLDEINWNLEWMLTMQDPEDGGVYHKLTTPSFEGFIKPEDCKKTRYVVQKSVTAALDFAASMAQASRIYKAYENDFPGLSDKCLKAAISAFEWAKKHPDTFYNQTENNKKFKPEITTGGYGDDNASDEFFWASTELYIATGSKEYLEFAKSKLPKEYESPTWGNVTGLAYMSWIRNKDVFSADKDITDKLINDMKKYADEATKGTDTSYYYSPCGRKAEDYIWGSNSDTAANLGMTLLFLYNETGEKEYKTNAMRVADYILGRNATGYCFITGEGTKSPMHLHHRLSASDNIEDPLPGLMAGGPNRQKQDGCKYPSDYPDESYVDIEPSYASNEMAINWQALATYLFAGVEGANL